MIEQRFNQDLQTCQKATDFQQNCHQFEELNFLIRHYQQKNMFQGENLQHSQCEFIISKDDLSDKDQEYSDIFRELPEQEENRDISTFFEGLNENMRDDNKESGSFPDSSWDDNRYLEDATDEEFGQFLVNQLKAIECENEKREIKRDILKIL